MADPIIDLESLIEAYKADPHMTHAKWVEWACRCAERVINHYEEKYPNDTRPRNAITAARRWIDNPAKANKDAAANAANAADAADAARAAADAAYAAYAAYAANAADAADAAYAAADAANAADAADAAAYAADAAAYAADAAYAAAYAADAAYAAERQWQAFQLMDVYHG